MNYRMLFILALLVLTVGVVGLVLMPSDDKADSQAVVPAETQEKQEQEPQIEVMLVKLNRDVKRGELLQENDFEVTKQSIGENDPLKDKAFKSDENDASLSNAKDAQSLTNALQGFAIAKDLKAGTFLTNDDVISPDDERFSLFAIDANNEVAYSLCVHSEEGYSLDTLKANDIVSVDAVDDQAEKDKNLISVLPAVKLLYIKKNKPDEDGKMPECYANVRLKFSLEQLKRFYEAKRLFVNRTNRFLLLPSQPVEEVEQRGKFIRSLRGAN